ncbi:MAG: putative quinol monooxygenase [Pseudonocardiaceae bacterium]
MSDRFGLVVKFTLLPGHEEVFDQLVSETLRGIRDREPGTLIYTAHRVRDAPSERLFYELYRDREAFDAHQEEPHVRRFLTEREQHLERVEVDFLTVAADKGLPPSNS